MGIRQRGEFKMRWQPKAKVAGSQYWQSMSQVGFILAVLAFILLLVSINYFETWLPLFGVGLLLCVALGWLRPHKPIVIGIIIGAVVVGCAVSYLAVIPSKMPDVNTCINWEPIYRLLYAAIGCTIGSYWGAALGVMVSSSRARRKAAIWGFLSCLFVTFICIRIFASFVYGDPFLPFLLIVSLWTGPAGVIVGATFIEARDAWRKVQPCLLYTSPSPRDRQKSRMPSSA